MAAYTTVDDVAARFPKFKRAGAQQPIASAARTANVVTLTFAANHGAQPGWSLVVAGTTPAGATVFDGSFTVASAPTLTTLAYYQAAADDTATGGLASAAAPGAVSDGTIQNWIDERASYIEAICNSRGYDLTALPAATAADAMVILGDLNKLTAQVMLGEAIAAGMGLTGPWQLLDNVRAETSDRLKSFRAGNYDKLFLANAKTEEAGPQLGGYVPGYGVPPCPRVIFRKDRTL